ncbi:hypothetical protein BDM02DRAFT_3111171 [Thelephora ganbajun]|uniref:Uncharacterized protein n=1 Tax=Thelephora ganbajun TaxID=370292 RepID=A0ACB6ZNF5_THEGA|nr:hypothetical protein BDM02DRAFT_3111171 [Thelephora ganbajun]
MQLMRTSLTVLVQGHVPHLLGGPIAFNTDVHQYSGIMLILSDYCRFSEHSLSPDNNPALLARITRRWPSGLR